MKRLQVLCRVTMGGVLVSIAIHIRLYYPIHNTFFGFPLTFVFTAPFVLSMLLPIYLLFFLLSEHAQIAKIVEAQRQSFVRSLRNAVVHVSRWSQLVLFVSVVLGGIFTLLSMIPTTLSPASHPFQNLSVLSIGIYSGSFLYSAHLRCRYLDWVLLHPNIDDHRYAVMVAVKVHASSAIPALLDGLRTTERSERDRIVGALASIGDVRTLSPLLELLETTPAYAQQPLKKAIQTACNAIHTVTFGTVPPNRFAPHHTLANYDFSNWTFPLRKLKRIGISTADYDILQVERFLTYVVSAIGQSALKNHVHVDIYGDARQLHPNIKNNLTNLCKDVRYDDQ